MDSFSDKVVCVSVKANVKYDWQSICAQSISIACGCTSDSLMGHPLWVIWKCTNSFFHICRKSSAYTSESDLAGRLNIFNERRSSEEPPSLQSLNGVNIYSHIDITQAILRQVCNSSILFLKSLFLHTVFSFPLSWIILPKKWHSCIYCSICWVLILKNRWQPLYGIQLRN